MFLVIRHTTSESYAAIAKSSYELSLAVILIVFRDQARCHNTRCSESRIQKRPQIIQISGVERN